MTIILIILALILLPRIYNSLFPLKAPFLENYFKPGMVYESKGEGVKQTILDQVGNKVYCELLLSPKAVGPPEHLHLTFNESGIIKQGILTVTQNGETTKLKAGERLLLNKGTYHHFCNETEEEVIIRSETDEDYVPVEFAYALSQIYPLMAKDNKPTISQIMKIAVLDELFDVFPKDASVKSFKTIKKVLKPYARLLGFSPYDERSKPR